MNTVSNVDKNVEVFQITEQYIVKIMLEAEGIEHILEPYLEPVTKLHAFNTLNQLYARLLGHGANRGNGGNAIRKVFGTYRHEGDTDDADEWEHTRELLYDFDPLEIHKKYTIYTLFARLENSPFLVKSPTIPVYSYCRTIIDGAKYFAENKHFNTAVGFYEHFINISEDIDNAERIVQKELSRITGIGKALSLDYLKELGFTNFVKPDVHTMDICYGLDYDLSSNKDADGTILFMKQIANDANSADSRTITPYALDKMWWLIGSGNFYDLDNVDTAHSKTARDIWKKSRDAQNRKNNFINYVKKQSKFLN